jgi:hypothetical protein
MEESKVDTVPFSVLEQQLATRAQARDHLLKLPARNHQYITNNGKKTLFDHRYDFPSHKGDEDQKPIHPRIAAAMKAGHVSEIFEKWYQGLPRHVNIPIAGCASSSLDTEGHHNGQVQRHLFVVSGQCPLEAVRPRRPENISHLSQASRDGYCFMHHHHLLTFWFK